MTLVMVVAAAGFTPLGASASVGVAAGEPTLEAGVLSDLNAIRVAHGLVPLTLTQGLGASALAHTAQMLDDGYFAHNSADGSPFWKRIQRYYPVGASTFWEVGENLLWSPGSLNAAQAVALWMASPPHRANILDPAWRSIGVAALSESDAPGVFRDLTVTVVTADFGVRS